MKTLTRRSWPLLIVVAGLAVMAMAATYFVLIPAGTMVNVNLADTLDSSKATAGQTFQITTADPLLVQGWMVAAKGAAGEGHVVAVKPPKGKKPASIAVQFDWITGIGGQHISLTATKGKANPLLLGAGGPLEKSFPQGKHITVGPDLALTAYVNTPVNVTVTAGP